MTFDEHEPHVMPRLYLAQIGPKFAGVCAPHERPGPWGPRVYFTEPIPSEPAVIAAKQVVLDVMAADDPYDPIEHADRTFSLPAEATGNWDAYMRGEIALATLASFATDESVPRYDIIIEPQYGPEWTHFIEKRFPSSEWHRFTEDGNSLTLRSNDIEDVRFFLAGHGWYLHTINLLTIVQRRGDAVAVVFCDWEDEKLYFLDSVGDFESRIAVTARARGLDVHEDHEGSSCMSSSVEYFASLQQWIAHGAIGLPPRIRYDEI